MYMFSFDGLENPREVAVVEIGVTNLVLKDMSFCNIMILFKKKRKMTIS